MDIEDPYQKQRQEEMKTSANKSLREWIHFFLIFLSAFVCGVFLDKMVFQRSTPSKFKAIFNLINRHYVDPVNIDSISELFLPTLLSHLDPHSVYINTKDRKISDEQLFGKYAGIGIEMAPEMDSITVVRVTPNGPAAKAGLQPRDVILSVNGIKLTTNKKKGQTEAWRSFVVEHLKGEVQSLADLKILRKGKIKKILIQRGYTSIPTISYTKEVSPGILAIRLNSWGKNTYFEFMEAVCNFALQKKLKGIIFDVRSNPGGLLDPCIRITNEFLKKGQVIATTKGKNFFQAPFVADGKGNFQNIPLAVLIDEESASASEVFAGAIQDHDRGKIIGIRSFGKGLVQEAFELPDSSEVRLTVARYYTPSGRCIQRPFNENLSDYYKDRYKRMKRGEYFNAEKMQLDKSKKYYTDKKRIVYGGGGIAPDIFVAKDSIDKYRYYYQVASTPALVRFAYQYYLSHPELDKIKTSDELIEYLASKNLLWKLVRYAENYGVSPRLRPIQRSSDILLKELYTLISKCRFGQYQGGVVSYYDDKEINQAIKALKGKIPQKTQWKIPSSTPSTQEDSSDSQAQNEYKNEDSEEEIIMIDESEDSENE